MQLVYLTGVVVNTGFEALDIVLKVFFTSRGSSPRIVFMRSISLRMVCNSYRDFRRCSTLRGSDVFLSVAMYYK